MYLLSENFSVILDNKDKLNYNVQAAFRKDNEIRQSKRGEVA